MSGFAKLQTVLRAQGETHEARRATRDMVDLVSHATVGAGTQGIRIINISPLGLMCRTSATFVAGDRLKVWLPYLRDVRAEVRWVRDGRAGMEFKPPIEVDAYERMLALMPPRLTGW